MAGFCLTVLEHGQNFLCLPTPTSKHMSLRSCLCASPTGWCPAEWQGEGSGTAHMLHFPKTEGRKDSAMLLAAHAGIYEASSPRKRQRTTMCTDTSGISTQMRNLWTFWSLNSYLDPQCWFHGYFVILDPIPDIQRKTLVFYCCCFS